MTKWLCRGLIGIAFGIRAAAFADTVVVPTDQATIQGAVNAAGAGGTVIINSNATFDETVTVTQSVTIHGGVGFIPTIRGAAACGVASSCTIFFHPNSASPQMLAVSDLHLVPKAGTPGNGRLVVRILNQGQGEASAIFSNCSIDSADGVGFQAFEVRRISCAAGLNHVNVQNGSIDIAGDDEAFAGEGGFDMPEGGRLTVSNQRLTMSGLAAQMFDIALTPDCGKLEFGLFDSQVSVVSTTSSFSADIANLLLGVDATIERNTLSVTSVGDGSVGGISVGGGTGVQQYTGSITLDANEFIGDGDRVGAALDASPFLNGLVAVTATNNVVRNMRWGFLLGQSIGNPAGTVAATLTNNTVDRSSDDGIGLSSAAGSSVTLTLQNNLVTNSGGWGISFSSEPGDSFTATVDYNGFFANAAGDVQAPLLPGEHDVLGDPIYVDRPHGNLRLGTGSPMLNAGNNDAVTTAQDATGAMRIQDDIVDIGAFEGAFPVATPTITQTSPPTATATSQPTASITPPATHSGTPSHTATRTATPTHTLPASPSATRTASRTASPAATATTTSTTASTQPVTPTQTPVASSSPSGTPAATTTRTARACVGDCDGSGSVGIDELLTMVNIALGRTPFSRCEAGDADGDGRIDIAELLKAVNSALNGCA